MTKNSLKSFLLYCTLAKDEYDHVRPLVWNRNRRTLKITSLLAAGMGLLFLLFNRLTHSEVWMPYLFLFCGSALVYLLLRTLERKTMREWLSKLLCYMEMLMVCAYAGILSTQQLRHTGHEHHRVYRRPAAVHRRPARQDVRVHAV